MQSILEYFCAHISEKAMGGCNKTNTIWSRKQSGLTIAIPGINRPPLCAPMLLMNVNISRVTRVWPVLTIKRLVVLLLIPMARDMAYLSLLNKAYNRVHLK